MNNLKNKPVILITGGSRGIGRSLVKRFAHAGWKVAFTYLKSEHEAISLIKSLEQDSVLYNQSNILAFKADAKDYNRTQEVVKSILNKWGKIDLLINNVGISYIGLLSDMSPYLWNDILNSNLTSIFNYCHSLIPHLVYNKSGKIINISSVWGEVGASCEVAYSTTKAAINGFTKALAKELAPSNIQVNAITLGMVETEMNNCFSYEEKQEICSQIPYGKIATSEEVADFIYNIALCTNYFTGQIVRFDGGWI